MSKPRRNRGRSLSIVGKRYAAAIRTTCVRLLALRPAVMLLGALLGAAHSGENLNRFYMDPSLEYHPTIYASKRICRYPLRLNVCFLFLGSTVLPFHPPQCNALLMAPFVVRSSYLLGTTPIKTACLCFWTCTRTQTAKGCSASGTKSLNWKCRFVHRIHVQQQRRRRHPAAANTHTRSSDLLVIIFRRNGACMHEPAHARTLGAKRAISVVGRAELAAHGRSSVRL